MLKGENAQQKAFIKKLENEKIVLKKELEKANLNISNLESQDESTKLSNVKKGNNTLLYQIFIVTYKTSVLNCY